MLNTAFLLIHPIVFTEEFQFEEKKEISLLVIYLILHQLIVNL